VGAIAATTLGTEQEANPISGASRVTTNLFQRHLPLAVGTGLDQGGWASSAGSGLMTSCNTSCYESLNYLY
jgi:hypothetical protein